MPTLSELQEEIENVDEMGRLGKITVSEWFWMKVELLTEINGMPEVHPFADHAERWPMTPLRVKNSNE